MTLILSMAAADGLVLASDSQITSGEVRTPGSKIHRLNDRCLWARAGELALIQRVGEHLDSLPQTRTCFICGTNWEGSSSSASPICCSSISACNSCPLTRSGCCSSITPISSLPKWPKGNRSCFILFLTANCLLLRPPINSAPKRVLPIIFA